MGQKAKVCLVLFLVFLHFTVGCAAKRVYGPGGGTAQLPTVFSEAKTLPEVQLRTQDGAGIGAGKIIGMEGRTVRFLPAPYWNVEAMSLDLSDIASIIVPKTGGGVGRAAAYGFGWGTLISGALCGLLSKYDEDYQMSLALAPIGGATLGLAALAVSALNRKGADVRYDLASMSDEEKTFVILKLMGHRR